MPPVTRITFPAGAATAGYFRSVFCDLSTSFYSGLQGFFYIFHQSTTTPVLPLRPAGLGITMASVACLLIDQHAHLGLPTTTNTAAYYLPVYSDHRRSRRLQSVQDYVQHWRTGVPPGPAAYSISLPGSGTLGSRGTGSVATLATLATGGTGGTGSNSGMDVQGQAPFDIYSIAMPPAATMRHTPSVAASQTLVSHGTNAAGNPMSDVSMSDFHPRASSDTTMGGLGGLDGLDGPGPGPGPGRYINPYITPESSVSSLAPPTEADHASLGHQDVMLADGPWQGLVMEPGLELGRTSYPSELTMSPSLSPVPDNPGHSSISLTLLSSSSSSVSPPLHLPMLQEIFRSRSPGFIGARPKKATWPLSSKPLLPRERTVRADAERNFGWRFSEVRMDVEVGH